MRAVPGDRLIIDRDPSRVGVVIAVPQRDGSPPYVVRWERSGHIALVSPDSYATIVPADSQPEDAEQQPRGEAR
jgi:Domain of unknown function (DUF1918)